MNPNAGAVLIAIGVFFILILNVQWDQIPELVDRGVEMAPGGVR